MSKTILAAGLLAAHLGDITTFNDQSVLFPKFNAANPGAHGLICAANDANFDGEHLSVPLTEYIVGAPEDEGLLDAIEAMFPSIPVGRSFSYRVHNTKEQFQQDADDDADIREIGGEFKTVRRTGTPADGRTDNKGLVMVLDNDQGGEDSAVQQRAVLTLRNRLLRSEIRRGLVILDANKTNTAKTWSSGTPDPDMDVSVAIDAGGDARGVDSNIVVWGKSAWIKRQIGLGLANNSAKFSGRTLTPQQAAELAGADKGIVLPFRYQSSDTAKSKVLGDAVFTFFSKPGLMADDATNIKRFVTMTTSGMFRVYVIPQLKRTLVCVEHYSRLLGASTLGINKLTIS